MFPVKQKTMRGAFIREASKVAAGDCNARFGKQWQVAKQGEFVSLKNAPLFARVQIKIQSRCP